jgi:hypothetical protein
MEFYESARGPRRPIPYSDISTRIENQLGNIMDVEDYILDMNRAWDICRFKPWIHLTGWMTSICFRRRRAQDEFQSSMGGKIYYSQYSPQTLVTDYLTADAWLGYLSSTSWEVLDPLWPIMLFAKKNSNGNITLVAGLILKHVEGDRYERLGAIQDMYVSPLQEESSTTPSTGPMDQSYLQTMVGYEKRSIRLG